jgi:hypothetical protein
MSLSWSNETVSRRALAAGAVGALGLAALSGCSKSSSANVAGQRARPSSKARELLMRAKQTVATAKSAMITGMIVAGRASMTVDLGVVDSHAVGTATINGGKAEIRVVNGELYLNGDTTFWEGIQKGSGLGFTDGWVKMVAQCAPACAALLDLVPVGETIQRLAPTQGSWAEAPGRTLNDVETLGVRNIASGGNTVYISKGDVARPVGVELSTGGLLIFDAWGKPVKAPSKPPGPILDASVWRAKP